MEELESKQRKERKELVAKTTALKKTATKGDKSKKKEVQAQIALMEHELEKRHEQERNDLNANLVTNESVEELSGALAEANIEEENVKEKKLGRQKLRQLKKKAIIEADLEQARIEAKSIKDYKQLELDALKAKSKELGQSLVDIAADGHCMYRAVAHQVETRLNTTESFDNLRKLVSEYLLKHKDDYMPFLTTEDGDIMNDLQYTEYCDKIRNTAVWGGDLELQALCHILKAPINVIQKDSSTRVYGEEYSKDRELWVSYHKHYYALGAHYNSLVSNQ